MRRALLIASVAGLAMLVGQSAPAPAAVFTYNATANATTQWSAGTNWDAVPVSASDTTLTFNATIPALRNVVSNNDIAGNFLLNQFNFTYTGPGSGTAPTVTVSGNPLEFVNDGATTPGLLINAGGTVKPVLTISANVILTNDLLADVQSVGSATNPDKITGIISGGGTLTKSGAGTLALYGPNTYTGKTTINAGTLQINLLANNGVDSSLGHAAAVPSAADLLINGGTLKYVGSTLSSSDRLFTIGSAGATIDNSSTNDATARALQFTSTSPWHSIPPRPIHSHSPAPTPA